MRARRAFKTAAILVMLFAIGGCGLWGKSKAPDYSKTSPEYLYQEGVQYYQKGKYEKAIELFQAIKEEHPLSKYAILAEIGIADSYFSDKKYGDAEANYVDFINLHPTNGNIPYAMYQVGICHYEQMASVDRDQTETLKAKKELEKLVARFPDSKYSLMAQKALMEIRKRLAEHEFYVGEFYFRTSRYQAALKRFEVVARDYANLGLDYKTLYFIGESKRLLAETDKSKPGKDKMEDRETNITENYKAMPK